MEMESVFEYILVGFFAQLIDGALGLAYGITSITMLSMVGMPIKSGSASVHIAEIFTSFFSGVAHFKARNIDWLMLKKILFPGMIGGLIGAYIITIIQEDTLGRFINVYLLIMGGIIIYRAKKNVQKDNKLRLIGLVGLVGGLFDAVGGGGWGPIVTSTMLASGYSPRYTVGTVDSAEFFVTLVQGGILLKTVEKGEYFDVILGLAIGGIIAAPLASKLCKKISEKRLMLIVGGLIILLNSIKFVTYLGN